MTSPYRVPSPPAAEPPETEHPYAAVLRAQRRRTRIAAVTLGTMTVLAAAGIATRRAETSAARRAEARARAEALQHERMNAARAGIEAARENAHAAQAAFERGIAEARARDEATPGAFGSCAPETPLFDHGRPQMKLVVVDHDTTRVTSETVAEVLADVQRAELHASAGRYAEASLFARALAAPGRLGREIVLVTARARPPSVTSNASYVPGELEGRAYQWDFTRKAVVCATDVRVASSHEVGFTYAPGVGARADETRLARLRATLEEDFRRATERAVTTALTGSALTRR